MPMSASTPEGHTLETAAVSMPYAPSGQVKASRPSSVRHRPTEAPGHPCNLGKLSRLSDVAPCFHGHLCEVFPEAQVAPCRDDVALCNRSVPPRAHTMPRATLSMGCGPATGWGQTDSGVWWTVSPDESSPSHCASSLMPADPGTSGRSEELRAYRRDRRPRQAAE